MAAPGIGIADPVGWDPVSMVNIIIDVLIASVLGMLAGMGIGGGSLLLLWLTQIALIPQEQARLINLLFYLPAAMISIRFRNSQNALEIKTILPAITAGCISAIFVSIICEQWNLAFLKKILGVLLIVTGIREILYRPRKAK